MKIISIPKLVAAIICFSVSFSVSAQNFHMVKDINDSKDAFPRGFLVMNGINYFSAQNGINGYSLWRSDATENGTYVVKIIDGGYVDRIVAATNNLVYFIAIDTIHGSEIWVSDGTTNGTHLLKDLAPGKSGSYTNYFTVVENNLFFSAGTSDYGIELWKTDGTEAGTILIKDIEPGNSSSSPTGLKIIDSSLFFTTRSIKSYKYQLWKSDGTESGTVLIKDSIENLLSYFNFSSGNIFYFVTSSLSYPITFTIWAYNTNTSTTNQLQDFAEAPTAFADLNGTLIYSAAKNVGDARLWKSDGTIAGTNEIKDVTPGVDSVTSIISTTKVGDVVFFLGADSNSDYQLYKTDGTTTGTKLVKSFNGKFVPLALNLCDVNGVLYFAGYTLASGHELWKSDGTESGTILVKDIYQGISGSAPSQFTYVNNKILFTATDDFYGNELWVTDGNSISTKILKDINQKKSLSGVSSSLTAFKNKVYFMGTDWKDGFELWSTDGAETNTNRVTDLEKGSLNSMEGSFDKLYASTNRLYFQSTTLKSGREIASTNGTDTTNVFDIIPGRWGTWMPSTYYQGSRGMIGTLNNKTFFIMADAIKNTSASSRSLWVVNENNNEITFLKSSVSLEGLTLTKNKAYFIKDGWQLWKTDGTASSTTQIINAPVKSEGFERPNIIAFNDWLFFRSTDNEMWSIYDAFGTSSLFKKINPEFYDAHSFYNTKAISINNTLYFTANDGISGFELWKTNGSASGTELVKDISVGPANGVSGYFTAVDNIFYFLANDIVHGQELWKSDGTTEGTILVKDITTGSSSSTISSLTQVGNKLAFLIYDANKSKNVLWQSDGTESGTYAVNDLSLQNVSINSSFGVNALVSLNNQLYFVAYTPQYGEELWTGTLDGTLPISLLNFTGNLANKDAQLNWTTSNEQNFSHFNLQRSTDGIRFSTIASINAKGNSNTKTDYDYSDKNINIVSLGSNKIYYRLEQVDKDGKKVLSKIVLLELSNNGITVSLKPNPVHTNFELLINNTEDNQAIKISVVNAHGKVLLSESRIITTGTNTFAYNSAEWPAGLYVIRINRKDGTTKEIKLIKQ